MRAVFCPTAAFTQIAGKGRLRDGGSSCEKHRNVPAKKHLALFVAPVIYYKSRRRKGDCRDGAWPHGLPTLKQAAFRPSHRRKKSDPVAKLTA